MEKLDLLLYKIEVNPVLTEADIGKKFHTGNDFKFKATRKIRDGNLKISIDLMVEDPDKSIRDPLAFIEHLTFGFKESKTASKFIGRKP